MIILQLCYLIIMIHDTALTNADLGNGIQFGDQSDTSLSRE